MAKQGNNKGRTDTSNQARDVINVANSLEKENDYVAAKVVEKKLGYSEKESKELLGHIQNSSTEHQFFGVYPTTDEGNDLVLSSSSGVRGHALRLSKGESIALLAAFNKIGISENNPLRSHISPFISAEGVDADAIKRTLGSKKTSAAAQAVTLCTEAIGNHQGLKFVYTKPDGTSKKRCVDPKALYSDNEFWYIKGIDHDDPRKLKNFKIDRMSELEVVDSLGDVSKLSADEEQIVELTFRNKIYIDYLYWPKLKTLEETDDKIVATIPYYGGTWLPRQVAACGGTVTTNNAQVNQLAREYAEAQLNS